MLTPTPSKEEKLYRLALSLVPGIGAVWLKKLLTHLGSAEKVFEVAHQGSGGVPYKIASLIRGHADLSKAKSVIELHEKENIQHLTIGEAAYPQRLLDLPDGPAILYYKGSALLNKRRVVSIIGTRQLTPYGQDAITQFVSQLLPYRPLIVSGLAYGTDILAHKQALFQGLSTVAVLPTSIDKVYPAAHRSIALQLCESDGGLITEYPIGSDLAAYTFVARNRIIAGMADVTIVIEAKEKSGALITAYYANSYHREVFALPGSIFSATAAGCHQLIKRNQAHVLTHINDVAYIMNWDVNPDRSDKKDGSTIYPLTPSEQLVIDQLKKSKEPVAIDEVMYHTSLSHGELQAALLSLELQGLLRILPGKRFALTKCRA
ncbi:MAG: DNA-processing protein DprA [Amoebophilaceae bacterium]|nr:DNA-processing protein DprA [Amoebophilaceae bacterium]